MDIPLGLEPKFGDELNELIDIPEYGSMSDMAMDLDGASDATRTALKASKKELRR